ncbi:MAG TPA: alkaline phosphatase family protein [Anaerolineae bacterium]|nr:alkaline phosphatase family protein [Anaerolineae bacterium]
MTENRIQHLLVLMLENRSFDHMLGYLEYPPGTAFEGLSGREAEMGNPLPDGQILMPTPNASYAMHPGPGHSHDDVLEQLLEPGDRSRPYRLANKGFAANYEAHYHPGHGALAMGCFTPGCLPVLATLAQEFAVCDHWFCSVPGATWPNRNFCHAGTADGQVNIVVRAYRNKTVFEQLSEAHLDWSIFYGGFPPQSLAFTRLWKPAEMNWLQRYKPIDQLYRAVENDRLPHYAFIEPDMVGKLSDSQHPGMGGEMDFRAGERLIWRIYAALRANPEVARKSLLVVTYDEHGGFFDHVPPPQGTEWSVEPAYQSPDGTYSFPFDLLGPRVPAVLISPWIERGTVDQTIYDHASIPATVRKLLHVDAPPLTTRDGMTNTFDKVLNRATPRDLPKLEEPFVDEAARRLMEEPDLRPSLMAILTSLIWTELRLPEGEPRPGPDRPEEALRISVSPQEVERDILTEIAPQLSPEAQRVLEQDAAQTAIQGAAEGFLPDMQNIATLLRLKAERLAENLELVDDLAHFVDLVLRRYFQGRGVILRTTTGASLERPGSDAMQDAIDELFSRPDPAARIWLADHRDRWLTVYRDGRATLHDREPDALRARDGVDPATALGLLALLKAGDLPALRRAFA